MTSIQLDLSDYEMGIIEYFKHKFMLNSKKEAIRKMIQELDPKKNG